MNTQTDTAQSNNLPNEETLRVIKDIEEGKNLERAKDADDLFKKLGI